jgi:site-specific DNA recombinase
MNLAREVMKGMKENALAGKHTGGKPPLGYKVDPVTKQLLINDQETAAVKIIFESYLAGKSYSNIIGQLNELGYKTKENRPFTNTSLHSILTNEKYSGTYIFNRSASAVNGKRNNHASKTDDQIIRIPNAIPALISKEDFLAVKSMMARRKRQSGVNRAKETYLLTGLIKCGKCGTSMIGNRKTAGRNKEIYHSYDCNNRKRFKTCDCKSVRKDVVEKMVIKGLEEKVFSDEGIDALVKRLNEVQQENLKQQFKKFERLKKELGEVDRQINNAV